MRRLAIVIFSVWALLSLGGCQLSQWAIFKRPEEKPVVYQGWDARYRYDDDRRRLVSEYKNRQIGHTWGRDESGLINYARWWSSPFRTQNLIPYRRAEEAAEREKHREQADKDAEIRRQAEQATIEQAMENEAGDAGETMPEDPEPSPFDPGDLDLPFP